MDTVPALASAVVAEIAYTTASGEVDAAVVHPLPHDGAVVLALPFARSALAGALAAARAVVVVGSDARLVLRGWSAAAATGRMRVETDLDGRWFAEHLVEEELRRYPPSRLLADSLMQRREHWWYLPRHVCRLADVTWRASVGERDDPLTTGMLAWDAADGLRADTVAVAGTGGDRVLVRSLAGRPLSGAADPACLLLHDWSVPDFERRTALVLQGRLEGDRLVVERRRGDAALPRPPGLLSRWGQARAFARACRQEIARARREQSAGHAGGAGPG